jgi:hypothetical protein
MNRSINYLLAMCLLLGLAQTGLAQEKTSSVPTEPGTVSVSEPRTEPTPLPIEIPEIPVNNDQQAVASDSPQGSPATVNSECKLCRWLEVRTGTISFRYRTFVDSFEIRPYNQLQHREIVNGRFKFDAAGRYSINAHLSSGYFFNWAYAGTGIGGGNQEAAVKVTKVLGPLPGFVENFPNSDGGNMRLRQLYFEARPVDGLEFQYGSLPILRGENTEITTFDDDGYVAGGRVSLKRPDKLFFDTIAVTYAYLGYTFRRKDNGKLEFIDDAYRPSFFSRYQHLSNSNYHQFLVSKKVNSRVAFSFDYTFHERIDYLHNAVTLKTPEVKALDSIRFEAYQRIGTNTFNTYNVFGIPVYTGPQTSRSKLGYSINGEKRLGKHFTVSGGFNEIDYDFNISNAFYTGFGFALNSDQLGLGKRFFVRTSTKITDDVTLSSYMSRAFDVPTGRILFNRTHINAAITWDFLKTLKRTNLF